MASGCNQSTVCLSVYPSVFLLYPPHLYVVILTIYSSIDFLISIKKEMPQVLVKKKLNFQNFNSIKNNMHLNQSNNEEENKRKRTCSINLCYRPYKKRKDILHIHLNIRENYQH